MRRLLEDFERLFDLDREVEGVALRELVHAAIDGLEEKPPPDWGKPGHADVTRSMDEPFVSFLYRPHLFPGMDLKLRLAHGLQFHLLPRALPEGAPLEVAAVLESYCHLSGDLFGWHALRDGRFLLWIVDISGHGVRSGLASAVLKFCMDHLVERGQVGSLVSRLNDAFAGCARPEFGSLFATGFFAAIGAGGEASYVSAGHPPVLLRRAGGRVERLVSTGKPIGMFEDESWSASKLALAPRDTLLLCTDGVLESRGEGGDMFGVERVHDVVRNAHDRPESLTSALHERIAAWQDLSTLEDDVTFVAARRRAA